MSATSNNILKYIPQRPPFVMVTELFSYTAKDVRSGLQIAADNVLVKDGFFQESGLVENMAQTTALLAGVQAHELKKAVPLGYIASIKNLRVRRLPAVGDTIFTHVELVNEVMNMQITRARVHDEKEQMMAECEMRIFIKPQEV